MSEVMNGIGRHIECIEYQTIVHALSILYPNSMINIWAEMFARISICLFLLRLFSLKKYWRMFMWGLIVFVFATDVASSAVVLPQCKPVAKLYNPLLGGTCWPPDLQVQLAYFNGG